jgi:hypothetical protein
MNFLPYLFARILFTAGVGARKRTKMRNRAETFATNTARTTKRLNF